MHHCSNQLFRVRRAVRLRASGVLALLFWVTSPAQAEAVWG